LKVLNKAKGGLELLVICDCVPSDNSNVLKIVFKTDEKSWSIEFQSIEARRETNVDESDIPIYIKHKLSQPPGQFQSHRRTNQPNRTELKVNLPRIRPESYLSGE
jgi:hypothetical protein